MPAERKKPWFPVKRFGYGAGLPIAWEGWLVLLSYTIAMILSGVLFSKFGFAITAILLSTAVLYIAYTRSNGDWRYRNGE